MSLPGILTQEAEAGALLVEVQSGLNGTALSQEETDKKSNSQRSELTCHCVGK